ncbi:ABC transporter permease subunit [Rhodoplanes sp. Z2-YC6860]|uniref:ABC transporter permease subunit n=1 Tax=Rhodoplanes sp. Z2-YC6860 TaxID=674703 RepID=UPI00078C4768|nr:ABC transporter permease [Rhodoplanes sp. Z2-YC6860]AMN42498.1 ABC-2 type transport system permease [Rhodoplanes sp. Z2-YC6860]
MPQREGSPWQGMSVVFFRELFDHLTSARMLVMQLLVVVLGAAVVYFAAEQIRNTTAEDPFLFLRLFAPPGQTLLSFVVVISILVPIMAIGLGFDSVNGEYNRRTMSRILAQPIYRDALLFGKFLAGLITLTICLVTLWLLVLGYGLIRLGIPPSGEEIGRLLIFLFATIVYGGIWLALSILLSVAFRSTATAALVALGLWLFLSLLWPALAQMLGEVISPSDIRFATLGLPTPDTLAWQTALSRVSPGTLYGEVVIAMLNPDAQSMTTLLAQFQGRVPSPLPLNESIIQTWPQMVSLIAGTILLYVVGYVVFQRQEVRA